MAESVIKKDKVIKRVVFTNPSAVSLEKNKVTSINLTTSADTSGYTQMGMVDMTLPNPISYPGLSLVRASARAQFMNIFNGYSSNLTIPANSLSIEVMYIAS